MWSETALFVNLNGLNKYMQDFKLREIKFRAWDKKKGIMFSISSMTGMLEPIDHTYNYVGGDCNMADRKDVVLMQYTGCKDKDGKEIYEGDIVRAVYRESEGGGWYSDHKVFGAVYFDVNWGVKFDCRDHTQRTASSHWYSTFPHEKASKELQKHWSDSSLNREYNNVEIIGNIFENKDLVKIKQPEY